MHMWPGYFLKHKITLLSDRISSRSALTLSDCPITWGSAAGFLSMQISLCDSGIFTWWINKHKVLVSWPCDLSTCCWKSFANLIICYSTIHTQSLPHRCDPSALPWPCSAGHVGISVCFSAVFRASSCPCESQNMPDPLCFQGNGTAGAYSGTSFLKDWRKKWKGRYH